MVNLMAYISSLSAGDYNVMVTDANGCSTNSIVTILEPVVLSSSVIYLSDVSCNGGSNGSAVISANGGITPYTYQWNNGQGGDSLSNLSAGNYNVVITDSNGCISANTITVSEPSLLVSSVSNLLMLVVMVFLTGLQQFQFLEEQHHILIHGTMDKLQIQLLV